LEITVLFLGIHKWEPDIYVGFSSALPCSESYFAWPHAMTKFGLNMLAMFRKGTFIDTQYTCGASKIKLKKVNKKRTVTVRRVIIFLNISRYPLLICLQCCLHQYKTLKAVATAIVLLTPAKNLKKVFLGFLAVSPLFNHFLG
jgi:hypothetical protein